MNGEHSGGDKGFELLVADVDAALQAGGKLALIGLSDWTLSLVSRLAQWGSLGSVCGLYHDPAITNSHVPTRAMKDLSVGGYTHVVVCANATKEDVLQEALPHIQGAPKVLVSGYDHFEFRDKLFTDIQTSLVVPSLANGYPNTLAHIYQCLVNAARIGLQGTVVEFGMFKGGTTMFMSKVIEEIKAPWNVIGFDTFDGFPARRSPLDMYDHQGCVFRDYEAVRAIFQNRNVEIVRGDIVETCGRVADLDIVLAFVDTDNFSPASEVVRVCSDRIVVGGAFVFDHFTGVDRFRYTLGERFAAKQLLADRRYFNLHGTGVFFKQV